MDMRELPMLAVIFVSLAFALTIGQDLNSNLHQDMCPTAWVAEGMTVEANQTANPVTSGNWGCCTTWNGSECSVWDTTTPSLNTSQYGSEGLEELGSWQDTIALIIVFAVIFGLFAKYMFNRI